MTPPSQLLDIATAKKRNPLQWLNEQWPWEKIVGKLSAVHRTPESYQTYITENKTRQGEIKDVGGFVGGYLKDGIRSKEHIKHRQILALDIDYGYSEIWDDFKMYYPCTAAIYSTHAHCASAPRLRIVLPLDRPVSPEEYEAIGRRIAGDLGTEHFDRTTFQAERMMFWPSASVDGDFYFKKSEGAWLNATKILSEYRDWHDMSEWPRCPTEHEIIRSDIKRQQDPTEKDGLIGGFCRAYPISKVIDEYLPDIYSPCADDGRYTYSKGSTAGGAIAYDDKFLFSHHSTDPAGGSLCNSFDLVRIHLFGAEKTSVSKMMDMAKRDPEVIKEIGIFSLDETITEGEDTDWLKLLDVVEQGEGYKPTIDNFLVILRNDPNLKGRYSYNEFDHRVYVDGAELDEKDEAWLRHYFEQRYKMYHVAKGQDAFKIACKDNSYHPIRDYLTGLEWDGVERLDTLFIDNLGVADNLYTRAVTRKSLVAAVARVMEPGIKFDYMTVMIGAQGKGKSSLLHDLGKEWFSDTLDSITGKEAYIQIQGVWLLEMAELSGIKRAQVEAVKNFISKREDRFRVPFSKHTASFRRQSVFFGSTNEHDFLTDPTGNRRFWPLLVSKKYVPGTINADPIWAEAVYRYKEGEKLFLTDALEEMAAMQQLEHTEMDERSATIERFVNMRFPADWEEKNIYERKVYLSAYDEDDKDFAEGAVKDRVCTAEIWCEMFGSKTEDMTAYSTKFIHNIMKNMKGWRRIGTLFYKRYGYQRSYVREGGLYDNKREENKDPLTQTDILTQQK